MKKFDHIRQGYHAITPGLTLRNAVAAIAWYKKVFGALEIMRLTDQDGVIVHAELAFDDSILMLGEEDLDYHKGPNALDGTAVIINLYVKDVDEVVQIAQHEGAEIIYPVADQFYGDRAGRIKDPFGHIWVLSTPKEVITLEEMKRRFSKIASQSISG